MKKVVIGIFVLLTIGAGCTSIEVIKSEIKQQYEKEPEINITGYWYNENFGPGRISQINNEISGAFKEYFVDGYVYGTTAYLIISKNNQDASSMLQLTPTKDGNLSGLCEDCFSSDNNILLTRETKESIRKRMDEDDSMTSGIEAGKKWLKINAGKADVNIDGKYTNFTWGDAVFIQNGNAIVGSIGSYEVEGVINGKAVYILIKYGKKLYYTAVMNALEQGRLMGKYFKGVTYSTLREGEQIILTK